MKENHHRGCLTEITAEMARFIEELEKDDEIASVEVQRILARKYGVQVSLLYYTKVPMRNIEVGTHKDKITAQ